MENDPYELNNLAEEPQYADKMKTMRADLEAWMAQQGDKGMETELAAGGRMNPSSQKYKLYMEKMNKKEAEEGCLSLRRQGEGHRVKAFVNRSLT